MELLWNASVLRICKRDTGVTSHAVPKVDAQPQSETTGVAIGTVKDRTGAIIIQMTDSTKVSGKRLAARLAVCIDASVFRRLKSVAFHTHHFSDSIPI